MKDINIMIEYANDIVNEFMKPVHKFIISRINNYQDAEDLVQEICIKIFNSLCIRDDILAVDKYVWTIVHNCLTNYYKGKGRIQQYIGVRIDDVEFMLSDNTTPEDDYIYNETIATLHKEIAYLSKTQREIVILYYYHGLKQSEIADRLGIATGTVKWYLSEIKTELKKGMEIMRTDELKFNPIKFGGVGVNGASSDETTSYLYRSMLAQNIAYCIYREKHTVNEIADKLGVSPVYIENELELMDKYGLVINEANKYITNFIIEEPTNKLQQMCEEMYQNAAKLIANELYDTLIDNDILDDENLYYPDGDKNFLMWTLIPYILANAGAAFVEKIHFDEVATMRVDGGTNILVGYINKAVNSSTTVYWSGPMWNGYSDYILWECDHSWGRKHPEQGYAEKAYDTLKLFDLYFNKQEMSKNDYAQLVSQGYLKGKDGDFTPAIVVIKDVKYKEKLLEIGSKIKEKHIDELNTIKDKYINHALADVPKHLKKMVEFGYQYIFYSDGAFLRHSAIELINNGRLKLIEDTDDRKKSLTSIILPRTTNSNGRFLI